MIELSQENCENWRSRLVAKAEKELCSLDAEVAAIVERMKPLGEALSALDGRTPPATSA